MTLKWDSINSKDDLIDYQETDHDDEPLRGHCHAYTPDCGAIKQEEKCQCGSMKTTGHSLCTACHSILPDDLKKDVNWCPEIYQAAVQYLTD